MQLSKNVRQEFPIVVFYIGLIGLIALFYFELQDVSQAGSQIPQYTIYLILLLVIVHFLLILLKNKLPYESLLFNPDDKDDAMLVEGKDDINLNEINERGVLVQTTWIIGYVISMLNIGFFTSGLIFVYAYIFLQNEDLTGKRKFVIPVIWAVGVNAAVYVLLVEFLGAFYVLDLGLFI